jgi:type II secretory pathway pseudopilin PulG
MPVSSTTPTSRRSYLSQSELAQFANITITDATEADDQISQAEEMIDQYVGAQQRFYPYTLNGKAVSGGASTITLSTLHQNTMQIDYLKWCEIEIIGGTGAGQRRKITGQTYAGVITVDSPWSTAPDSTSVYKIYQLGKFPRPKDVFFDGDTTPNQYYKSIPENVKRAVAAQVEFIIEMGSRFFSSDQIEKQSESIGDYSYTNAANYQGVSRLIAPKAKMLLRGIRNITGEIVL